MPFVQANLDDFSKPPSATPWFFYHSEAQIDDPAFCLPTPPGPTTAAAALTSTTFSFGASESTENSETVKALASTINSNEANKKDTGTLSSKLSWFQSKSAATKIYKEMESMEKEDNSLNNDEDENRVSDASEKENAKTATPLSSKKKEKNLKPEPPVFATASFSGAFVPNTGSWTAFNPNNNKEIEEVYQKSLEKNPENDENDKTEKQDEKKTNEEEEEVLVGYKRLYKVCVKERLIKPVFWHPVRDVSHVIRAEWFFSSSLTPVEPSLEEAVSKAFNRIRPWSREYIEELKIGLQVPEAFDKIKVPITFTLTSDKPEQPPTTYNVFIVFAPCLPSQEENASEKTQTEKEPTDDDDSEIDVTDIKETPSLPSANTTDTDDSVKVNFQKYPIAYVFSSQLGVSSMNPISYLTNPTNTQIISCLLSGRTPSSTLAIIQRYFNFKEWKKIRGFPERPSDELGYTPPKITELIFVIHGIGQKLTERLESFDFTFAINRFNILIADQLSSPNIQQYLKKNTNIVAIPVHWRRTLDFDALKNQSEDQDTGKTLFTLQQITMGSIPAIRNIISDVMLDIPYYMSHYKKLLIKATVNEANRLYKLFLKYNPDFEDYGGRVHVIGHSLGSVLALDILSSQPTDVRVYRPKKSDTEDEPLHFCFNTHNVFFCGSPVGFFLLLENSSLIPRQLYEQEMYEAQVLRYEYQKTTMEMFKEKLYLFNPLKKAVEDGDLSNGSNRRIKSAGSFSENFDVPNYYPYGCMGLKKIYNVLHYSDPIAYCLNPTVDPEYADSIDQAILASEKMFPLVSKPPASSIANSFNRGLFRASASLLSSTTSKPISTPSPTPSVQSLPIETTPAKASTTSAVTERSGGFMNSITSKLPDIFTNPPSMTSTNTEETISPTPASCPASLAGSDVEMDSVKHSDEEEDALMGDESPSIDLSEIKPTKTTDPEDPITDVTSEVTKEEKKVSSTEARKRDLEEEEEEKKAKSKEFEQNLKKFKKKSQQFTAATPTVPSPTPTTANGNVKESTPTPTPTNKGIEPIANSETEIDEDHNEEEDDDDDYEFDGPLAYAKKKMHMLNDNGQVDFVIPLVGTLENQYLSMLSAHGSYWDSKDFARLVAIECGRPSGRKYALEQYSAKPKNRKK